MTGLASARGLWHAAPTVLECDVATCDKPGTVRISSADLDKRRWRAPEYRWVCASCAARMRGEEPRLITVDDFPPPPERPEAPPKPPRVRPPHAPSLRAGGGVVNPHGQNSQVLLAVIDGLDVTAIGRRVGLPRQVVLAAMGNLRRVGLCDAYNRPTAAGHKRAELVRALLAAGGAS